jgi:tetratricopeptide (TPR) repeat protein
MNPIQRAKKANPYSAYVQGSLAFNLYCARRFEEAVHAAEEALQLDHTFPTALAVMGLALEETGQPAEAVENYQLGLRLYPSSRLFMPSLGRAFALLGRKEETTRILEQLTKAYKPDGCSSYGIASIYAALGKTGDALKWLERAFIDRCFSRVMCRVDPRFEILSGNPRFRSMLLKAQDESQSAHKLLT